MKEQLLNTLPEDVRVWVSERKPTTSAEAGQLAEDYLQARKMTLGKVKPESETRSEQRSGEIPKKCQKCGRQGHWTHDCWSGSWKQEETNPARDPPKSEKSMVRCFTCQQRGHYSTQCPRNAALYCDGERQRKKGGVQWKKRRQDQGVTCCGTICGTPVKDILLDTGSTRTLVKKDLVPRN